MAFDARILAGVGVLAAVVEGGSFVKGAELLGITASGVSRAIGRLETRLNIRLLERTTRSISLTDEGSRFYHEVRPHLAAIEESADVASGSTRRVHGRLKVDMDPFFLPLVLAGRLGEFCDRYPELSIEFVSSEDLGDLVSDGVDIAVRFGQSRYSSLVSRKLVEAPILTVASPRYLAKYGRPNHPKDLSEHRCLQFRDPLTKRPFEWEFTTEGTTFLVATNGPMQFTDPKTMLQECIVGSGIAQIIGWGVREMLEKGELIDLFPNLHGETFPLFAFYPSRKFTPAKVQAFTDFCREIISGL